MVYRVVEDVLRALRREHVARWVTDCRWCAGDGGQVVVMPSGRVPPELVNVTVDPRIIDMPRSLGVKGIPTRAAVRQRCAHCAGEIVMMPAGAVPPELVDMPVVAPVDDMLRPLDIKDVAGRLVARQWRPGGGGQVAMVPPVGVPPDLVNMTID